eukprot:TRINITY_DN15154_c0_g3_i1.p1 TRINITY_DN15154_c0_g3~~TRINITY_DN15154_c0_g3_i1.p1  ORF type:complete len:151 (+),score=29.92 TRINITY_DN15154_c0_g3_i1:23-454(+)
MRLRVSHLRAVCARARRQGGSSHSHHPAPTTYGRDDVLRTVPGFDPKDEYDNVGLVLPPEHDAEEYFANGIVGALFWCAMFWNYEDFVLLFGMNDPLAEEEPEFITVDDIYLNEWETWGHPWVNDCREMKPRFNPIRSTLPRS